MLMHEFRVTPGRCSECFFNSHAEAQRCRDAGDSVALLFRWACAIMLYNTLWEYSMARLGRHAYSECSKRIRELGPRMNTDEEHWMAGYAPDISQPVCGHVFQGGKHGFGRWVTFRLCRHVINA